VSRRAPVALIALAAMAIVLSAAATASANPRRIGGLIRDVARGPHPGTGGAQPSSAPTSAGPAYVPRSQNLSYGGGPVLHSNRTHVVFWEPAGSGLTFEPGYETLVSRFLAEVAADSHMPTNVYGLSGQYRDGLGAASYASTFGGSVLDAAPLPPNGCSEPATGPGWTACLTDAQLESELQRVVLTNHLPTTATDVYFIVTPNGLGDCIDASSSSCALGGSGTGYCGYHSQTLGGLLYAVIPYNAIQGHCQSDNPRPNGSPADPTISTVSHEHNEVVTDPQEDAWIDSLGNENGDLCIQNFGPVIGGSGQTAWNELIHGGHYYLQEEWSNEDGGCRARDEIDRVSFTGAAHPQAGKRLSFVARTTDPDGSITTYNWFFGDGVGGHGRTPAHVYRRAGVYRVVLRTTNRADNWTLYARTVRVAGAAAHRKRAG
jgi:hypothetical protein